MAAQVSQSGNVRGVQTRHPWRSIIGQPMLLVIAAAELVGLVVVLRTVGIHVWALVLVHMLALALLMRVVVVGRRRGDDTSLSLLALVATSAVGPAGAVGAWFLSLLQEPESNALLEQWYARISLATTVDPVSRLCDNVSVGRAINLEGPIPPSYPSIIEVGTLAERQAVLGLIARQFHTDYLPVLQSALKSGEPAIRIQAAAVAVHVRPEIVRRFQKCVDDLPAAIQTPAAALDLMARLEALVDSGLVDETDRKRGIEIGERLGDAVLSGLRNSARTSSKGLDVVPASSVEALERLLLRRGRFSELRSHRNEQQALRGRRHTSIRRFGSGAEREGWPGALGASR